MTGGRPNLLIILFLYLPYSLLIGQIDYSSQIQPIFLNHCLSCHVSVNGSGALELDSYEYLMQGDSNNGPVVIPFNADSSLLYKVLSPIPVVVPNEPICCQMPKNADPLSINQQELIRDWINQGAIGPTASIVTSQVPQNFLLHVYPNPFNNVIRIRVQSNDSKLYSVFIFDILGKRVKTLINKKKLPSNYSFYWQGDDDLGNTRSAGVYIIGIKENENLRKTKKILYLK